MTKKELIEALEPYDDDVVVCNGESGADLTGLSCDKQKVYSMDKDEEELIEFINLFWD